MKNIYLFTPCWFGEKYHAKTDIEKILSDNDVAGPESLAAPKETFRSPDKHGT